MDQWVGVKPNQGTAKRSQKWEFPQMRIVSEAPGS
jgi:hypothetical protein